MARTGITPHPKNDPFSGAPFRKYGQNWNPGLPPVRRHPGFDRDVRLVWYADVLSPASSETCDYTASDPRARRDAATDPNLKSFVSLVGSIFGALTNVVSNDATSSA